ncbi:MAG: hypothetical protein JSV18_06560 [Candidatus Bathyarchaeota archaeon]|nr:MAG: hypothetical protein JSV18_06560 [Candidatus Bathyarchaeota archaeon]
MQGLKRCWEDDLGPQSLLHLSKSTTEKIKNILFVVVLSIEILIPLIFYLGLRYYGDSQEVVTLLQGMMVITTSGLFFGVIAHLIISSRD